MTLSPAPRAPQAATACIDQWSVKEHKEQLLSMRRHLLGTKESHSRTRCSDSIARRQFIQLCGRLKLESACACEVSLAASSCSSAAEKRATLLTTDCVNRAAFARPRVCSVVWCLREEGRSEAVAVDWG